MGKKKREHILTRGDNKASIVVRKQNDTYDNTPISLTYRKADISDLTLLTQTRIEVLKAANQLEDTIDMSIVEQESFRYFRQCFENDSNVTYLAFDKDRFAGCGSICYYEQMPTFHNPSGRCAYIMNMYTRPEFRRRGIALHLLDLLVLAAKQREITHISLEATHSGRPLYEKYGFVPMKDEMLLPPD